MAIRFNAQSDWLEASIPAGTLSSGAFSITGRCRVVANRNTWSFLATIEVATGERSFVYSSNGTDYKTGVNWAANDATNQVLAPLVPGDEVAFALVGNRTTLRGYIGKNNTVFFDDENLGSPKDIVKIYLGSNGMDHANIELVDVKIFGIAKTRDEIEAEWSSSNAISKNGLLSASTLSGNSLNSAVTNNVPNVPWLKSWRVAGTPSLTPYAFRYGKSIAPAIIETTLTASSAIKKLLSDKESPEKRAKDVLSAMGSAWKMRLIKLPSHTIVTAEGKEPLIVSANGTSLTIPATKAAAVESAAATESFLTRIEDTSGSLYIDIPTSKASSAILIDSDISKEQIVNFGTSDKPLRLDFATPEPTIIPVKEEPVPVVIKTEPTVAGPGVVATLDSIIAAMTTGNDSPSARFPGSAWARNTASIIVGSYSGVVNQCSYGGDMLTVGAGFDSATTWSWFDLGPGHVSDNNQLQARSNECWILRADNNQWVRLWGPLPLGNGVVWAAGGNFGGSSVGASDIGNGISILPDGLNWSESHEMWPVGFTVVSNAELMKQMKSIHCRVLCRVTKSNNSGPDNRGSARYRAKIGWDFFNSTHPNFPYWPHPSGWTRPEDTSGRFHPLPSSWPGYATDGGSGSWKNIPFDPNNPDAWYCISSSSFEIANRAGISSPWHYAMGVAMYSQPNPWSAAPYLISESEFRNNPPPLPV